ncbi:acetylglutamate kinase [Alteromonas sp. a30]|uniref:acetylglutamate kinase n=1 Tax=Alteromonas sp. a30 TaxID=2730917 RepID=UPI002283214D|nr:acetylglutamate kinase [Alteromonas sp. a30]MCY7295317.1 acetylglutamate kinase [Alteromonas sp. a30]
MTDLGRKPIAVIKVSGDALLDKSELKGLVENIKELIDNDWDVVILHGGQEQITACQEQMGLETRFIGKRRITNEADLKAVKMALAGEVNVELVSALQGAGINAFGCHGASGKLIEAKKRPPRVVEGCGSKAIDLGLVGDVTKVNSKLILNLIYSNVVPVIASLGIGEQGEVYNINADTSVVAIAKSIQADLLVLTTTEGAIYRNHADPSSRIQELTRHQFLNLIDSGRVAGDMVPRVEEAMNLLDDSVEAIAVVSGKEPNSFINIADDKGRSGTRIVG